jgi:hypothetical protein
MKGSFLNANELRFINRAPTPLSVENLGIAAVVPAYLLHEILFSNELKENRRNAK